MIEIVLSQIKQNLPKAVAHDRASTNKVIPESIEVVFSNRVAISMSTKRFQESTNMRSNKLVILERSRENLNHLVQILNALVGLKYNIYFVSHIKKLFFFNQTRPRIGC